MSRYAAYTFIRCIGRGSNGICNVIRSNDTNTEYVMKEIPTHGLTLTECQQAEQEASILRTLRHPSIVEYVDSFLHEDKLCIVMTYCRGGDLASVIKYHIKNKRYISQRIITRWLRQLLLALQYCHTNRVIHRDMKTQNIFLTKPLKYMENENPSDQCDENDDDLPALMIGDFGIARVLTGTQELATSVVGTPYSMSPEVCENKPYSFSSDIWALGCVLYELCQLRHAFDANNLLSLVWKIVQEQYDPIPSHYTKELHTLIQLMLHKDSQQRPSASEILKMKVLELSDVDHNDDNEKHEYKENHDHVSGGMKHLSIKEETSNIIPVMNYMIPPAADDNKSRLYNDETITSPVSVQQPYAHQHNHNNIHTDPSTLQPTPLPLQSAGVVEDIFDDDVYSFVPTNNSIIPQPSSDHYHHYRENQDFTNYATVQHQQQHQYTDDALQTYHDIYNQLYHCIYESNTILPTDHLTTLYTTDQSLLIDKIQSIVYIDYLLNTLT